MDFSLDCIEAIAEVSGGAMPAMWGVKARDNLSHRGRILPLNILTWDFVLQPRRLAMRNALQISLLTALMTTSAFAEEWAKTFSVSGRPDLYVRAGDGSVHVRSWDRKEIEARVSTVGWAIGPNDLRIIEHQTGDRVELEVRVPNLGFGIGRHSIKIELQVPRDLKSDIHTGDGSISLDGLRGETHLSTGDGSIHAEGLDGTLDARTGDGSIQVRGRFDVLALQTGDGSIHADIENGSKMTSSWNIRTGDGSLRLRLPATFSADLDVRTGDGGIHTNLPVTSTSGRRENELRGKLNAGGPLLTVRTNDGSVSLERL